MVRWPNMGGKISKAKRPKRRWIGITIPSSIRLRSELVKVFESSNLSNFRIKLYDCHLSDSVEAQNSRIHCQLSDDVGIAIVSVLLSEYKDVREILQSKNELGLSSFSSSGKIRLVRERMALSKPRRR